MVVSVPFAVSISPFFSRKSANSPRSQRRTRLPPSPKVLSNCEERAAVYFTPNAEAFNCIKRWCKHKPDALWTLRNQIRRVAAEVTHTFGLIKRRVHVTGFYSTNRQEVG